MEMVSEGKVTPEMERRVKQFYKEAEWYTEEEAKGELSEEELLATVRKMRESFESIEATIFARKR